MFLSLALGLAITAGLVALAKRWARGVLEG